MVILVWCLACLTVDRQVGASNLPCAKAQSVFDFSPVIHDWVNKGLGMPSRVCATGHYIKDPVPLIKTSGALCPGGRFPPTFIHHDCNHHHWTE